MNIAEDQGQESFSAFLMRAGNYSRTFKGEQAKGGPLSWKGQVGDLS
jgi:hypothetical protein